MEKLIKKLECTRELIRCWVESFEVDGVYVAFSGGLDSTVLLDIARKLYPDIMGVFNNTGLELPEIISFVKTFDNIITLTPKMSFHCVIKKYGWPVISKEQAQFIREWRNTKSIKLRNLRWNGRENGRSKISECWKRFATDAPFKISEQCCDKLKTGPSKKFEKETGRKAMVGIMSGESQLRRQKHICNLYDAKRPISRPMLNWNKEDVWSYIKINNISYSQAYDRGWERTGCVFCMIGIHKDHPNRFQMIKNRHPKLYKYCIYKLGAGEVLDWMGIDYKTAA